MCFLPCLQCGFMDGSVGLSVGPPLWSTLKYLNNHQMDCHEIFHRHSWCPEDESCSLYLSTDFSYSSSMRLTFAVLSEMSRQLLDGSIFNNFGGPLAFHLTPSSGQIYSQRNSSVYDQTPQIQLCFMFTANSENISMLTC